MRRILVDNARRKHAERHGGKMERVTLEGIDLAAPMVDDQLLAIHETLIDSPRTTPPKRSW